MKKIILEREKCIGCGTCSVVCPSFWEMSDDGRTNLKNGKETDKGIYEIKIEDPGCNREAEESCPVNCIHIRD